MDIYAQMQECKDLGEECKQMEHQGQLDAQKYLLKRAKLENVATEMANFLSSEELRKMRFRCNPEDTSDDFGEDFCEDFCDSPSSIFAPEDDEEAFVPTQKR